MINNKAERTCLWRQISSNGDGAGKWEELITNQNKQMMLVRMWTRPVLCRLCECPATDGGVRVDQLDAEKLSEWWLRKIGEEFLPDETPGHEEVICQFCIWDARLEHEYSASESNSGPSAECTWWSRHDNDKLFVKFYYQDEVIQRCRVELGLEARKMNNEQLPSRQLVNNNNHTASASRKPHNCLICASVLSTRGALMLHLKKLHAGQFVPCKFDGRCAQIFLTEEEKNEHVLKDHKSVKKCEICHQKYYSYHWHIRNYHQNLVRCSNHKCNTFFSSEEEMLKHNALIHAVPDAKKCIFCGFFYIRMLHHLRQVHKSQFSSAFKCTFCQFPKYFLTEAKLKIHIDISHKDSINCIYCGKKWTNKKALKGHVNNSHGDVKIMCTSFRCGQYFHTQTECDSHLDQFHRDEKKTLVQCTKCTARVSNKYHLKRHEDHCHGTKNIPCPKCGKYFSNLEALNEHLKTHEAKICQHCEKQIKILHMKTHLRQTKCENCLRDLFCVQSAKRHRIICSKS